MIKPRALMTGKRGQIAQVGHRIVSAAREMVGEELDAALRASASELPHDATAEQIQRRAQMDPTVQFWAAARERLVGEQVSNQPWRYIVIDSPSPNAFVTEVLPQSFFLTTSLLKVATTPDELAVVLGHESTCATSVGSEDHALRTVQTFGSTHVLEGSQESGLAILSNPVYLSFACYIYATIVSHLIHGHLSETNRTESILRSLEILLLSLDPTSGVISLAVIGGLAATRRMISARHSRDHEYEADDMGLALAARACFDTHKGSHVMRKMNELKVSVEPEVKSSAVKLGDELLASHPPSLERFERMQQRALEENFQKYRNCSKAGAYSLWRWT
jgi:Zn-dependent protease with chaperone function